MATQTYYVEIGNEYLNKYKRITGRTAREVELKAAEQIFRWSQEEDRAREKATVADEKERARHDTEEALTLSQGYRDILKATLPIDDRISWSDLENREPYPHQPPRLQDVIARMGVPEKRPVMEKLRPALVERRENAEKAAREQYENLAKKYKESRREHIEEQNARNEEISNFRNAYEAGEPEAVEEYVSLVLANSAYPEGFPREFSVQYAPSEQTVVVDIEVPAPANMPRTVEYKYVAIRRTTNEVFMKDREFQKYYDEVVHQTMLRTLHEIFEGDYEETCLSATVNGWVQGVDPATGRDFRSCISSCQAERTAFLAIDLARVDPEACFRELRGSGITQLASLKPVAPIRRIEREDPRFIEAKEVLEELESGQNLITIDWQDFEMLVRDLFEKIFDEEGTEVNVTRASRDEGVDAVVINPDPFKGGKTIIQAKRYRKTVPVAAVRELYGSMQNERAGRGILVTTGRFGKGAHDFVRDKEITLLDGANLIHMLQNHGHNVRIDPTE